MLSEDPFVPLRLFATPLFSAMISGHESHRQGLLDCVAQARKDSPSIGRSNRGGWHSGAEFLALRDPHIGWLLQNVLSYARKALAPMYNNFESVELKLGHYWANVLPPHAFNAPHHHHPQHWSGVYYVSVPGAPPTDPDDRSGLIEFLNPDILQSQWGQGSFAYRPREGLTLLFPSSIVHLVYPHSEPEDRVSIAYNFNVVPKGARPPVSTASTSS